MFIITPFSRGDAVGKTETRSGGHVTSMARAGIDEIFVASGVGERVRAESLAVWSSVAISASPRFWTLWYYAPCLFVLRINAD